MTDAGSTHLAAPRTRGRRGGTRRAPGPSAGSAAGSHARPRDPAVATALDRPGLDEHRDDLLDVQRVALGRRRDALVDARARGLRAAPPTIRPASIRAKRPSRISGLGVSPGPLGVALGRSRGGPSTRRTTAAVTVDLEQRGPGSRGTSPRPSGGRRRPSRSGRSAASSSSSRRPPHMSSATGNCAVRQVHRRRDPLDDGLDRSVAAAPLEEVDPPRGHAGRVLARRSRPPRGRPRPAART